MPVKLFLGNIELLDLICRISSSISLLLLEIKLFYFSSISDKPLVQISLSTPSTRNTGKGFATFKFTL